MTITFQLKPNATHHHQSDVPPSMSAKLFMGALDDCILAMCKIARVKLCC